MEKHSTLTVKLIIAASIIFIAACQREEGKPDKSSVVIQMPSSQDVFGKVGALAAIPINRKICFAVNVTGEGLPSNSGTCQPTLGVTAGFVESGQTVEVEVKSGESRKIDLLMHLKVAGDNSACPSLGATFPGNLLSSTYLVGTAGGVSLQEPEVTVNISVNFPGESQNIAQTLGLPGSCLPLNTPAGGPKSLASALGTVTNANYELSGRAGLAVGGSSAGSANFQLKINAQ